jgi:hypothetical protein
MESTITLTQSTKHPSSPDLQRVRGVRFRHLFAHFHAIVCLYIDGQEKLSGAYIFDRHYIISLVDKTIDLSRKLVFDASILAPEGIRGRYADFDACKQEAENRFLKHAVMDEADTATQKSEAFESTAEYRQLQLVLEWIGGHQAEKRVSIFEFLNGILRHVFRTFEKSEHRMQPDYRLTLSVNGLPIHIEYLNMDWSIRDMADRQISWEDLACAPLIALLKGALKKAAQRPASASGPMWALAGSDELSLFQVSSAAPIWLEVSPSVDDRSCHVLLFSQIEGLNSNKIPADFRAALTPGEILVWESESATGDIQQVLTTLGGILFGNSKDH